ncbi:hypothetical protein FSP39_024205 [Pinctada imbricata]|uniref:Prokaryotic-type class I peptide chain release factors domain-containing protein n=1 Tax=Pinctada imbricata TaxID=66713 RepID=A0AA89CBM5_PINIB|nr:hypothetical protein FSP39_024205 [Pinctada imbricata]
MVEFLLPLESTDENDVILEVNPGVGGQEASLFTKDIFEMYQGYAQYKGWTFDIMEYDTLHEGTRGSVGLKSASASISGLNVYKLMKFESGVHRVQRVPKTEAKGRVHTSTMTVAVLPQPKDINIDVKKSDLKIETFRASGKGGQSVNTTDSAVRIIHLPTGIKSECREERSQAKNMDLAMKRLYTRIYDAELMKQVTSSQRQRKIQVGSAARSEKIRTYNYNQNRITEHRIHHSMFDIEGFMSGSELLDDMIHTLMEKSKQEVLAETLENFEKHLHTITKDPARRRRMDPMPMASVYFSNYLKRPEVFEFLRISKACNASQSATFTNSFCDMKNVMSPRIAGMLGIEMNELFEKGFQFLHKVASDVDPVSSDSEEGKALSQLCDFINNVETHQKHILNAKKEMENCNAKEAVWTKAVAEHLLSHLAPTKVYHIDVNMRRDDLDNKCACDREVNFGATGIGHSKVWHGYADIIISEKTDSQLLQPVCMANVYISPDDLNEEALSPSTPKRKKLPIEEESMDAPTISKVEPLGVEDQAVAQTIVFALTQRNRCRNVFIPNVIICPSKYFIVMYEPEKDILVWSQACPLFEPGLPSTLRIGALITLWMVLHYRLFCSGGEIFDDVDEVKANFHDRVTPDCKDYYVNLRTGISHFDKENLSYPHPNMKPIADRPKIRRINKN